VFHMCLKLIGSYITIGHVFISILDVPNIPL
jgi:hypothetical protein